MQSRVLNLILSQRHEDLHADRIVQNVAENRKTILTLAFTRFDKVFTRKDDQDN